ncbi:MULTISPECIES: hypothetical protein [Streptomyces]|uniref:hypothetical protein n=1 Tax=Streptomyces TaxID=1883 RepID=UPI0029CEE61C|nr:hypothetical protein [Streptomyces sp. F8]MDX6763949.1 hypothetical protein [Streptomyces sp. F8]
MSPVRRRTLVRAAAVTACAGSLLALPTAAALAEGVPAVSSAHSSAPQRTLVKSLSLADGVSTARIYRTAEGAYQADILAADGARATTLTSRDGVTDVGSSGDLHAALDPEGRLTSWVGDAPVKGGGHAVAGDGHKTGTRDGQIIPVSAEQRAAAGDTRALEAASAESRRLSTLADGPGDGILLLAAGGGIAAVGAAGLGFAMLRRGRTDG